MVNPRIKNIYAFSWLGLSFLITLIFINVLINKEKEFYSDFSQSLVAVNLSELKKISELQKPITLMFVGDIMLERGVEYYVQTGGSGDFRFPFLKIADYLKKSDILFGNLESLISDKGVNVGSIYSFRADPEAIKGLIYARFDIISVANNHIFDYGREAMEDNFRRLKAARIDYVGGGFNEKEAHSPIIKEIKRIKVAYLAYTNLGSGYWAATENQSGIAWLDEGIVEDIKLAKEKANIVIVSMHFGEEYQSQPTLEQKYFSHLAIDSGADLVIGHHSHIVQPIEKYQDYNPPSTSSHSSLRSERAPGYIAYSLGNFVFDQGFSEETMKGLLLEVLVKDGKIIEVIPRQIKINNFFQPELAD